MTLRDMLAVTVRSNDDLVDLEQAIGAMVSLVQRGSLGEPALEAVLDTIARDLARRAAERLVGGAS